METSDIRDLETAGAETTHPSSAKKRFLLALILTIATLSVYLLSMPIPIQDNLDARVEATLARESREGAPWRPNHLLLTPTFRYVLELSDRLGWSKADHLPLQLTNAVLGATSIGLFFLLAQNLGGRQSDAILGAVFMAFSYGPWLHSREAESAMPSQFFLIGAVFLVSTQTACRTKRGAYLVAVASGVAISLSILYSLNCILFVPALVAGLTFLSRNGRRLANVAFFTVTAGLMTTSTLVAVGFEVTNSLHPGRLLSWLTYHPSSEHLSASGELSMTNILRAATGLPNYFVGATPVTTAGKMWLQGQEPIGVSESEWLRAIAGGLFAIIVVSRLVRRRPGSGMRASFAMALWAFLACGPFLVLWLGSDPQFWLPLMVFLLANAGTVGSRTDWLVGKRSIWKWIWAAGAVILFAMNFGYAVPTIASPQGNEDWQTAERYARLAQPEDLIIYLAGWPTYLNAFGNHRKLDLLYGVRGSGRDYLTALTRTIDETISQGGNVFALEVFESASPGVVGVWEEIEALTGVARVEVIEILQERYKVTSSAEGPNGLVRLQSRM